MRIIVKVKELKEKLGFRCQIFGSVAKTNNRRQI